MLLIVTDGGLLMHHRDDKPGIANPGCWAGFGGAVEDGETVEEALHREVAEETGLVITDPVFLTDAVDHEGDGRLVSLFYVCGDAAGLSGGEPPVSDPLRHHGDTGALDQVRR
jgi:8-oxo-dGTP pyrophosphatase MutT (NUDIX family)